MPQPAGGEAAYVHKDEQERVHQAQHKAAEREQSTRLQSQALGAPGSPPRRRTEQGPPGPQGSA
eukprot:10850847-Lingulodinium_polyedra.AAC.1